MEPQAMTLTDEMVKYLQTLNVFFATPAYGGLLYVTYHQAVMETMQWLNKLGVPHQFHYISNESLITRARNSMVAKFLGEKNQNKPYTHIFFLDADIGFDCAQILRCLLAKKHVACGVYPRKTVNYEQLMRFAPRPRSETMKKYRDTPERRPDLPYLGSEYNLNVVGAVEQTKDGYMKVLDAATGFMCISRPVIDGIVAKFGPVLKYKNDIAGLTTPETENNFYTIFETRIDPTTRRYLSEDYSFCRTCQDLGYEIWIDMRSQLTHTGTFAFRGSVGHFLSEVWNVKTDTGEKKEETKKTKVSDKVEDMFL